MAVAEIHHFRSRRDGRTLEQAKQELAALKFSLFETVAADPLLDSTCLSVAVIFASLVTVDKRSLEFTAAYVSNGKLHIRAGIKSHNTAKRARLLLEKHGYLIPVGKTNGMTVYQIANPHQERVLMHVREFEEYDREVRAEKKRAWRIAQSGMSKIATPKIGEDVKNCHPGVSNIDSQGCQKMTPNTLKEYLSVIPLNIGSEGKDFLSGDVEHGIYRDLSVLASIEPSNSIFAVPASEKDALSLLETAFGRNWPMLHTNIQRAAMLRLINGRLSREWVIDRIVNLSIPEDADA